MAKTGVFCGKEDLEKLRRLVVQDWRPGEMVEVFSEKDKAIADAMSACHKLALAYGLPEIPGYYGITEEGEFVSV